MDQAASKPTSGDGRSYDAGSGVFLAADPGPVRLRCLHQPGDDTERQRTILGLMAIT
jgi:hypothetical protein